MYKGMCFSTWVEITKAWKLKVELSGVLPPMGLTSGTDAGQPLGSNLGAEHTHVAFLANSTPAVRPTGVCVCACASQGHHGRHPHALSPLRPLKHRV